MSINIFCIRRLFSRDISYGFMLVSSLSFLSQTSNFPMAFPKAPILLLPVSNPIFRNTKSSHGARVFPQSSILSATTAAMPITAKLPQAEVCFAPAAFEVLVPTFLLFGPQFVPRHTLAVVAAAAPAVVGVFVGVPVIRKPCSS